MAPNQKNEQLKSLEKKCQKVQRQLFTVTLLIVCSGNSRKFPQKSISSPDLRRKKIQTPTRCFFIVIFWKFWKTTLQSHNDDFDGNGTCDWWFSCDRWLMILMSLIILTTRYESNLKVTVWNGSEKFMSVKIHVLKKASVPPWKFPWFPKIYSGIRRYSLKQIIAILFLSEALLIRKICIFYSYSS